MIAVLLAAQLSAEIMRGMPAEIVPPRDAVTAPSGQLTTIKLLPSWRQAFGLQAACASQGAMQTSDPASPVLLLRPQDRKAIRLKKLGDLPKANKEVAVLRSVDGCAVPVGIRYSVEGDGKFAHGDGH